MRHMPNIIPIYFLVHNEGRPEALRFAVESQQAKITVEGNALNEVEVGGATEEERDTRVETLRATLAVQGFKLLPDSHDNLVALLAERV